MPDVSLDCNARDFLSVVSLGLLSWIPWLKGSTNIDSSASCLRLLDLSVIVWKLDSPLD